MEVSEKHQGYTPRQLNLGKIFKSLNKPETMRFLNNEVEMNYVDLVEPLLFNLKHQTREVVQLSLH